MRSPFGAFGSPTGLFRGQSNKDNDKRISMGNVTSLTDETMPHAGAQRLTKPRTNTNSHFTGVARNDSGSNQSTPSKPSSRGTTGHGDDRHFDQAESPFSFSSDSPLNLAVPSNGNIYSSDSPFSSAPDLSHDPEPLTASAKALNRHSAAVDGSDFDIGAAIALLQQLKKNASPEDLIALHKALLPTRSVDPEVELAISVAQEPVDVTSPLIRRSSLLPAGLATRISLEAIKRRTSRKASHESKRRSGSQVTRGQNSGTWEQFVEGGFDSLDPADKKILTRAGAATPSDFDITHIGSHRLGSLRVTNGAASPEPSLMLNLAEQASSIRTASGSAAADGFVTADEGETNTDSTGRDLDTIRPSAPPLRVRISPGPASAEGRTLPKQRSATPNKTMTPSDGSSTRALQQWSPQHRASDMAREYLEELDSAEKPCVDGAPLATHMTRLSTVEDNSPVEETFGGPRDALKKLTGVSTPDRSRQASGGSDSSASRPDLDDGAYLQAPRRPSVQTKSDSGYSSETSWQAKAKAHIEGANVDDILNGAVATAIYTEYSPSAMLATMNRSSTSSRSSVDGPHAAMAITTTEARPLVLPLRSERCHSLPLYGNASASASQDAAKSVVSTDVKTVKPQKQHRKLQKVRPQSQQQPTVQPSSQEAKADTVPSVPDNISINFSRRLVQKPGMSHLDQTFTSVDQVDHKDSAVDEQPSQSKQEDDGGRGRGREPQPKATSATEIESPKTEKRKSFLGRLRSRSRSQHRRPASAVIVSDEPMPSTSDFTAVAQSIGSSPYDIATRNVTTRRGSDGSRPAFHPCELTIEPTIEPTLPRVNMDDETAANYARMKSRDIAEQQAEDRRARSQSRTRRHIVDQAVPTSRPSHKRSVSAHPNIASASTLSEQPALPQRPVAVRVGTIKFDGGEAQGRLSPLPMERPKTKRRTQSMAPSARSNVENADAPSVERVSVPAMPKLTRPVTTSTTYTLSDEGSLKESPAVSVQAATSLGWETQARLWRERKKNLDGVLTPAPEKRRSLTCEVVTPTSDKRKSQVESYVPKSPSLPMQYTPTKQTPRHSPAIVISRYVTPTNAELEAHIGHVTTDDPYAAFCAYNPTEHLPPKDDVDRTDSATSNSTYKSAMSHKSSLSATYHRMANYRAYRPDDAVSMTKLVSPQQQGRSRPHGPPVRSNTAPVSGPEVAFDRYSGGLGYGWERGNGFGGSAGTRQGSDRTAQRKSVQLSESFGVDLSDVPVFLTRA